MKKKTLYINDSMFQHAKTSSWYNESDKFEWIRYYHDDFLVFTDESLTSSDLFNNKRKYAWLLESPEITKHSYQYIKENYDKFDLIFTFNKDLLNMSSKFKLIPCGGCWIYENDRKLYEKTKLVSSIISAKRTTEGHLLRHQVKNNFKNIDFFGHPNYIQNKITGLKDYSFSVVIENCKKDFYFTEKIIDCFVTGTIPIYWGCPSIGEFFDTNGILSFETIDELKNIIDHLNVDIYYEKMESIKNNFELAKKYIICDDLIFDILEKQENLKNVDEF